MRNEVEDLANWLDSETRAVLCADPPDKLIATATTSFSLLLIVRGKDEFRVTEIVSAIRSFAPPQTIDLPFVVAQNLELDEAIAGQLALVACDCISAFVRDEVVNAAATETLRQLHKEILSSPEFEQVSVQIESIPESADGRQFRERFFGATIVRTPSKVKVFRKKARLIELWAKRIGATVFMENTIAAKD
jgi:hypothetical protein